MSDEAYAPSAMTSVGRRTSGASVDTRRATSVSLSASAVIGAVATVAAGLAIFGAFSPWFAISFLTATAHIGGLNAKLDGRYAMVLSVLGLLLAMSIAVLPLRSAARRPAIGGLGIVGVVGTVLMRHQYRYLKSNGASFERTAGMRLVTRFFGVNVTASWGFWLVSACFLSFVVAAVAAYLVPRGE
jgi:hypothetical protein